uniref:Putative secreted protein n=1 Tax=Anopheles darlingi TaxID=43151 RepID=A0A2M4D3J5_ANODA
MGYCVAAATTLIPSVHAMSLWSVWFGAFAHQLLLLFAVAIDERHHPFLEGVEDQAKEKPNHDWIPISRHHFQLSLLMSEAASNHVSPFN